MSAAPYITGAALTSGQSFLVGAIAGAAAGAITEGAKGALFGAISGAVFAGIGT